MPRSFEALAHTAFRNGGPTPEQQAQATDLIQRRGTRALTDQINQQIARAFGSGKQEKKDAA